MVGLIGSIGPWELILVLAILLIIVGPESCPVSVRRSANRSESLRGPGMGNLNQRTKKKAE